jgi:putative transport protein
MSVWLEQFLVRYPELALFLVIAAGYWIGSFKIAAFSLGPVMGALFAGLLVGQFAHVPVSDMTKSFLFLMFLFGIGYSVGPQFMQALKRDGLKPVLLAVAMCLTGLAVSILVAKALRLDPAFAALRLMTSSSLVGPSIGRSAGLAPLRIRRHFFTVLPIFDIRQMTATEADST